MLLPFGAGRYVQFDSRGFLWCADTRHFAPKRFRPGDRTPTDSVWLQAVAAPVTPQDRRDAEAAATSFMSQAGTAPLDFDLIPATKPVLQRIDITSSGWLLGLLETREGRMVVEFDPKGLMTHRGLLSDDVVPVQWLPILRSERGFFMIGRDSLDVPQIHEFQWPRR